MLATISYYNNQNSKFLYNTYNAPTTILITLNILTKFNPYPKQNKTKTENYVIDTRHYLQLSRANMGHIMTRSLILLLEGIKLVIKQANPSLDSRTRKKNL